MRLYPIRIVWCMRQDLSKALDPLPMGTLTGIEGAWLPAAPHFSD